MKPQLYLDISQRRHIIERHDFYVAQVKTRVLSHFVDIENEAECFAETEYQRLGSMGSGEHGDMCAVAEAAEARAQNFYALLSDLKKQTLLGALAGCYHQWDKELRGFLERELMHNFQANDVQKLAWSKNVTDVLKQFGWDIRERAFFLLIDACRLIVNVYKHGKGPSLDVLAKYYPIYLRNSLSDGVWPGLSQHVDHEWLDLSEVQFDEIAAAMRQFWDGFPERLYLEQPDVSM
jgi:hypothetical protein